MDTVFFHPPSPDDPQAMWKFSLLNAKANFASWYIKIFTKAGRYLSGKDGGRDVPVQEVMAFLASETGGYLEFDKVSAFCGLTYTEGDGNTGIKWNVSLS